VARCLSSLLLFACLLPACTEPGISYPLRIQAVDESGVCPPAQRELVSLSQLKPRFLRVTVLGKVTGEPLSQLICDERVDLEEGTTSAELSLGRELGLPVQRRDLWVEAFDASQPPKLVAAGEVLGFDLTPRLQPLQVLLVPVGKAVCAPGALAAARAFHSSTLLPNGQVVLVGGITSDAQGRYTFERSVEIYEPREGTFRAATGALPEGRAFHSAYLVGAASPSGPFDLVLAGGIAPRPGSGEAALAVGGASDPFPLMPGAGAIPADPVLLRYYGWADPPLVEARGSASLGNRIFHASTEHGGQHVLLGGMVQSGGSWAPLPDFEEQPADPTSVSSGPFPMARPRVGAAVASLDAGSLLVIGGNLLSVDAGTLTKELAEVIRTDSSAPGSSLIKPGAGSDPLPSSAAFATLTASGDALLLAGGLAITPAAASGVMGSARALRSSPLTRITADRNAVVLRAIEGTPFVPVVFHAAQPLRGGEVLWTGGLKESCLATLCGSAGISRYVPGSATVAIEGELRQPRLGHTMVRWDSGAVLVAGGLGGAAPTLAHRSAELLMPAPRELKDQFGRTAGELSPGLRCR